MQKNVSGFQSDSNLQLLAGRSGQQAGMYSKQQVVGPQKVIKRLDIAHQQELPHSCIRLCLAHGSGAAALLKFCHFKPSCSLCQADPADGAEQEGFETSQPVVSEPSFSAMPHMLLVSWNAMVELMEQKSTTMAFQHNGNIWGTKPVT
ncbi:hypothetical protein WJX77_000211 [Trebouxia sp. C0004]